MHKHWIAFLLSFLAYGMPFGWAEAQSSGTAGTMGISVVDATGAALPTATIKLENRITGFQSTAKADASGTARITGIPPNPYHLEVSAPGFQTLQKDVDIRSTVPLSENLTLQIAEERTTVEVHAESTAQVESVPTAHTDIDRNMLASLPKSSPGSGLSDVITLASPGIVADSNGFFHPLGDHAETGFSIDNQPVTDQQSKQFSNQLPLNAIGSFEVISGAAPAEYGDKASLVVNAITRSALGQTRPTGSFSVQYGSFGTIGENFDFGIGGNRFGNFLVANTTRSGRYLDAPEFTAFHDVGNNQQIFDRLDYQPGSHDMMHLNLFLARSWFQTPNTNDQVITQQDQRQLVRSYNIAPAWTHLFGPEVVLSVNPFFRQDQVQYFPSRDPFADAPAAVSQYRRLSNLGLKTDLAYANGIHNIKIGAQVTHYFLHENFHLGITDPSFNPVCVDATSQPVLATTPATPAGCAAAGYLPNPNVQPGLVLFDLSRGGQLFGFRGHTDVKQEAFFAQDAITFGHLTLQTGLRSDIYRGLSSAGGIQPRLGVSYLLKPTNTVFRVSYSKFFETPYNENLVLSSATGAGGLATNTFGAFGITPLKLGVRTQYNTGFQQGIGKLIIVDAEYTWKYTHNAFDFDTLFNTPIAFPIEWRKSKIDGLAVRVNLASIHGFSAFTVLGHTRARFFGSENGGLIFNSPLDASVFRIDHDQAFQQTTYLRYQYKKDGPWFTFTWRYDSGLIASRVPDLESALGLSANQQATIGFFCDGVMATRTQPITTCPNGNFGTTLLRIPPPGTYNADTNPARVAPRNLFDVGIGFDNLFHSKDTNRWTLKLTAVNITNEVALYNFLSTFSGTHFVTPRSYQAELGFNF